MDIIRRYPDITPTNVIGHSDISIGRKSDPGASFPWEQLYKAGIGAWYEESTMRKYQSEFHKKLPTKKDIVAKLKVYGYGTTDADSELGYRNLIRAFQLHFRQTNYDGRPDVDTIAILYALVEKYFPQQ
ncbi:hypothetical protein [Aeromonas jandaei]|uniref:hypothetical protein n=1 Tax=Aeromonas jandaei TaxID=650 RepID=UPI002AA0B823|nr:hypothetical protein [Aeromonas jandaei]